MYLPIKITLVFFDVIFNEELKNIFTDENSSKFDISIRKLMLSFLFIFILFYLMYILASYYSNSATK